MLEDLRRRRKNVTKNIVAWTLFSAIIVVFIFWGAQSKMRGDVQGASGSAATVNSRVISIADYQEQVENLSRNPYLSQFLQGETGRKQVQMMAVNQLVNSELAVQAAEKQGVRIPDAAIREVIRSVPVFQENGKFRRERYQAYLQGTHRVAADFEEKLRRDEMIRETERLLSVALEPSPLELEKQKEIEQFKANAEFVAFSPEAMAEKANVSEGEAKAYLEKAENKSKVESFYAAHKAEFNSEEQVHARHILIKANKTDPKSLDAAKAKAAAIEKRLQAKEDFAKVAKETSEDPGSKANGGDLGFFSKGRMVPQFEQAAFSLPVNKISEPIQTDYGFHIIQVLEKKQAHNSSLDEVRVQIAKRMIGEEKVTARLDQVRELLKKGDVAGVQKWAADNNLKWEDTGAFSITAQAVPKVGNNDQFATVAFSLSEKKPLASEIIRQGETQYIVKYKAVPASDLKAKPSQTEKADLNKNQVAMNRAQDAFQRWLTVERKNANITVNPSLSSASGEMEQPPDAPF